MVSSFRSVLKTLQFVVRRHTSRALNNPSVDVASATTGKTINSHCSFSPGARTQLSLLNTRLSNPNSISKQPVDTCKEPTKATQHEMRQRILSRVISFSIKIKHDEQHSSTFGLRCHREELNEPNFHKSHLDDVRCKKNTQNGRVNIVSLWRTQKKLFFSLSLMKFPVGQFSPITDGKMLASRDENLLIICDNISTKMKRFSLKSLACLDCLALHGRLIWIIAQLIIAI